MVRDKSALTVFYNGACPICRREISHYRRLAEESGAPLAWCDVTTQATGLGDHGVTGDDAVRRLHALDADGRLLAGIDAFAAVWERLPRWAWLASVLRWRPARRLIELLYERAAAPLLAALHRRRSRRAGALAKVPRRG